MKSRALWLPLCLAVLGTAVPLRESVAAQKVDLEAYLGDVPMQDDSRTFTSEVDETIDTATAVSPGAKRTGIMYSSTNVTGDYVNTELDVIVHGKMLLIGTRTLGDITFFTKKPKKAVLFKLKPNKAYPFSIASKVFMSGVKIGKGKEYGTVTFLGFEEVTTPLGTFPEAAHIKRTDNLRVKNGKHSVESKLTIETWVVAGLGSVRFIESEELVQDKVVTDSLGPTEWLLDHAIVQGVPFPAPEPTSSGVRVEFTVQPSESAGVDLSNAEVAAVGVGPGRGARRARRNSGRWRCDGLPARDRLQIAACQPLTRTRSGFGSFRSVTGA